MIHDFFLLAVAFLLMFRFSLMVLCLVIFVISLSLVIYLILYCGFHLYLYGFIFSRCFLEIKWIDFRVETVMTRREKR